MRWTLLLALAACHGSAKDTGDPPGETGVPDTEPPTETGADTDTETGETGHTDTDTETGETGDTHTGEAWPAGEVTGALDCPIAAPEGLATRVWWPSSDRARYGETAPVLVRTGGANWLGWDIGHDPAYAVDNGAIVVQYLRPGTSASDGWSSGGVDDLGGPSVRDALRCVLEYVAGTRTMLDGGTFSDAVPFGGVVVATGLSMGGNHVTALLVDEPALPPAAAVLWESPLTDQITLQEMAPLGEADPLFEAGSCTLDQGCPFHGRAGLLRWDGAGGVVYQDLDDDAVRDKGELYYRPLIDEITGQSYFSTYMLAEIRANEAHAFPGGKPGWWPSAETAATYWRGWVATDELQQIRDSGDSRAWFLLASGTDHAQVFHEHTRVGQMGLSGADFFRLNPDVAYGSALGGGGDVEFDAGTLLLDPAFLDALPDPRGDVQVLAAELEAADRVVTGTWDADLDAPIYPVVSLR